MSKAICIVSIAPVRREPSDTAEMITQLLFGELCEIIAEEKQWLKIKSQYDNYEGWLDSKQIKAITQEEYVELNKEVNYVQEPFETFICDNQPFPVTIGAELRNIRQENFSEISTKKYQITSTIIKGKLSKEQLLDLAFRYINTPYLWGGKSTYGIDCSGFTQMVYKIAGYFIPRDAYQQAEIGEVLSFIEEAEPGDLAFFENEEGKIIHVGFILSGQKILHAHGKVRVDNLDYTGIFNLELNKYTHKLRFIRKIF